MSKKAQRGLRNVLLPHTALSHTVHPQPCMTHNESSAHSCSRDSPNLGFDLICHCHTINSHQIRAHLFLIWIFANAGYRYHKRAVQKTRRSSLIWVKSLCQSSVVADAHTADPPRTANQLKALLWCPRPDTIPAEGKKPPWQDTRNSIKTSFRMSKKWKIIWRVRSGDPPFLFCFKPSRSAMGREPSGRQRCLQGHAQWACCCLGSPRGEQNWHLPRSQAVAAVSSSALDILPADSLPECNKNCQREFFPGEKHLILISLHLKLSPFHAFCPSLFVYVLLFQSLTQTHPITCLLL